MTMPQPGDGTKNRTPKLLAELHRITAYDPDHLPREISLIEALQRRHPKLPQVACFDTAFFPSVTAAGMFHALNHAVSKPIQ
jgi:acetate kinase